MGYFLRRIRLSQTVSHGRHESHCGSCHARPVSTPGRSAYGPRFVGEFQLRVSPAGPERPDIGSLSAPLNARAIIKSTCATGFGNPDAAGTPCVDPATVHFIEGSGNPNSQTVGRNTLRAPGIDNLDLAIAKRFRFTERMNLEYRVDMFNALNTLNLGYRVASRTVNGSAPGSFLDFNQTASIARTMRMRLKFSF